MDFRTALRRVWNDLPDSILPIFNSMNSWEDFFRFGSPRWTFFMVSKLGDIGPEALPIILKDPFYSLQYAILKGRWPEAESIILTDPQCASEYAAQVLRQPWPEAEPFILTDPIATYIYVVGVKGIWDKAEATIMQNPDTILAYAVNVLKRRWPEAEPLLSKCPYAFNTYKLHFRGEFNEHPVLGMESPSK